MLITNHNSSGRADVFSRGALELTFKLLRKHNARLALDVQNQLQGKRALAAVMSNTEANLSSDHFHITLDASTVGKVVDALTTQGQELLDSAQKDSGALVLIRSLIKDWVELAEWILLHTEVAPSKAWH
jgi:hypothetical protein